MQITVIKQDNDLAEVKIVINEASGMDSIPDVINTLHGHPYDHRALPLGSYITTRFFMSHEHAEVMQVAIADGASLFALKCARNWHKAAWENGVVE